MINKAYEARWKKSGMKGATTTLYYRLLKEQGGVCAICKHPPKVRRLALDHDHKTGAVRGLLCFRCNYALPWFEWFMKTEERFHTTRRYLKNVWTEDLLPPDEVMEELINDARPNVAARRKVVQILFTQTAEANPSMTFIQLIQKVAEESGFSSRTVRRYVGKDKSPHSISYKRKGKL